MTRHMAPFTDRCELVADALQSLAHLGAEISPATSPALGWQWGEDVPQIVIRSRVGSDVLVRLAHGHGWMLSGGIDWRTRIVAGEDLVEAVATLRRGDYLDAPAAYADWSGERRRP